MGASKVYLNGVNILVMIILWRCDRPMEDWRDLSPDVGCESEGGRIQGWRRGSID
jgi:hypothetical protein